MRKKLFNLLLLVIALFPFVRTVCQRWADYRLPFNQKNYEDAYAISQYSLTEKASWIPDEVTFTYASWYYLNGGSPILVNPDYPPLGKYLVALSIKLFNSEKLPSLLFGFLSLLVFFLLSRLFLKPFWLAILPVIIFSWERLYQEQLIYIPLFETFALTFLSLTIFFFIKANKKTFYFLFSSLFLGCLWATKPWMLTIPLLAAFMVDLFLKRRLEKIIGWLISLPLAVEVVVLSYFRLLAEGWSVYRVLSIQKWIAWYHRSKIIKWGTVWPYLYLRRWYVWWGEKPYLPIVQWNFFWPIFTTLGLILSLLVIFKIGHLKFRKEITVICFWFVFYLFFLNFGNITTRYVFYLLPFAYLLGVYFINTIRLS